MTFEEWLEENENKIHSLDGGEALYQAWLAGYEAGMNDMGKFAKELWDLK